MAVLRWSDLPLEEPYPGIHRRRFDGHGFSAVLYHFAPGAAFPLHRHPEEQLVVLLEGRVCLHQGDDRLLLAPGDAAWTPPGVPHAIEALEGPATLLNLVVPRRTRPLALHGEAPPATPGA